MVHTQPISYLANVAAETTLSSADHRDLRIQLIADAGAALVQIYSGLIYRGPALVRECVRATAG